MNKPDLYRRKIAFAIVCFVALNFTINSCAFAVDDIVEDSAQEVVISKPIVKEIDFEDIIKRAEEHSYDLQIADLNKLIAKQDIRIARSDYYPRLNFNAGTEYTKNFRDIRNSIVTTVGDAFINPYTRYQSILGITLSYNIFDFGVRRGTLDMAKEDAKLKDVEQKEKYQELNLNIVDLYSKISMTKRQIELNKNLLAIEAKNLELKNRLFNAKELAKTELNDAQIKVDMRKHRLSELSSMLDEDLLMLSFYTGDNYDINNLFVKDMKRPNFDTTEFQDYTKSLVWKKHEIGLKKKELELKVVKRTNLPKVTAYSRYYLYGSDHSSYNEAWSDFSPSNYTVGGSINMPLFDGFKNHADIKKTELELKSLQIERDKAIAEYMTRLATLRSNLLYMEAQISNDKQIIKQLEDKEKSVNRLLSKKLVSPIELNDVKIELLEQQIELEKNTITANAIVKGIQILTTTY